MAKSCPQCGTQNPDVVKFCTECGTSFPETAEAGPIPKANPEPIASPYAQATPEPIQPVTQRPQAPVPPEGYRRPEPPVYSDPQDPPLKALTFMGLMIVFAIPVVGFITALILSLLNDINRNIRSFARANLWFMIIAFVLGIILWFLFASLVASFVDTYGPLYFY